MPPSNSTPKKNAIFICTGNSCRSQIAEGLLRSMAGDRFNVYSAGTHPSRVNPMAMAVMEEWGLDLSGHTSDPIDRYLDRGMDIVITVCDHANESCPVFPGDVERIHWSIDDPFMGWTFDTSGLDRFRETRDSLKEKLEEFLKTR